MRDLLLRSRDAIRYGFRNVGLVDGCGSSGTTIAFEADTPKPQCGCEAETCRTEPQQDGSRAVCTVTSRHEIRVRCRVITAALVERRRAVRLPSAGRHERNGNQSRDNRAGPQTRPGLDAPKPTSANCEADAARRKAHQQGANHHWNDHVACG